MSTIEDYFFPLTDEQLSLIKAELKENDELAQSKEEELINWIDSQPHFPKNYDRRVVKNFLRGMKYNVERTKPILENHYRYRSIYRNLFENRDPNADEIKTAIDKVVITYMPKLTDKGEMLVIYKLSSPESIDLNPLDVARAAIMIYDVINLHKDPLAKLILLLDYTHFSTRIFFSCLPYLKSVMSTSRNAYAIRLAEVHIIHSPAIVHGMISTVKPFLHEKLQIFTHSDFESLAEHIPKKYLPADMDGELPPSREISFKLYEIVKNYADWFREQETCKIDDDDGDNEDDDDDSDEDEEENVGSWGGYFFGFDNMIRGILTE